MLMPSPPSHTTQTTKVELPKWVDEASQSNYKMATDIAGRPYQDYKGQTVAAFDPRATKFFSSTMGTGNANISRAESILRSLMPGAGGEIDRANALAAEAGRGITGMDRSAYMNPFTDEVIGRSMTDFDRQRQLALSDNASDAIKAKAFGGSRSAIIDAVTNSESVRNAGDLSARLRAQGFDTATSAMQSDLDRKLGAASTYLSGADRRMGSAGQFSSLADQQMRKRMQDFAGLTQLGDKWTEYRQRMLDDARGKWQRRRDAPVENLNLRLSALGMSPYGKTETVDKKESTGTDFAQLGAGVLSILPSLFMLSDRTEKTDIKKVGEIKTPDGKPDIPLYSYRYKGDPKTYPKVVGPMAQDIQKVFPDKIKRIGGKLAVSLT